MSSIRRLAIVANHTKSGVAELAAELAKVATAAGTQVAPTDAYPLPDGALAGCDACAVLGGDGTMLGVVAQAAASQVPVFGINRGKLGFLAGYDSENAAESLREVLRGDYRVEHRTLLECRPAGGRAVLALNDIVITSATRAHLARLRVKLNNEFMNSFRCDGLIITTPTGSTAYNLAAGGPLIDPRANVFAITPICPHTLSNRSLVFSSDDTLSVDEEAGGSGGPLEIMVDGVRCFQSAQPDLLREAGLETRATSGERCFQSAQPDLPLRISLAGRKLPLVQPTSLSHFDLLRNKLRWV